MITLKNLHEASEQELFDQVAAHLLKQNRAASVSGSCQYRTLDGLKCAAGCLIGEGEYDPDWEGAGWRSLVEERHVPSAHYDFIGELQTLHDMTPPSEWKNELRHVAKMHSLNAEVLDHDYPQNAS